MVPSSPCAQLMATLADATERSFLRARRGFAESFSKMSALERRNQGIALKQQIAAAQREGGSCSAKLRSLQAEQLGLQDAEQALLRTVSAS